MTEFEIAGIKYRANPMDARRQFHVAMKLVGVMGDVSELGNPMRALSAMSLEDSDFVINACLAVVERQMPGEAGWGPIMTPTGIFMHEDLRTNLAALMQIVIPVIEANAAGFLSALPKGWFAGVVTRMMEMVARSKSSTSTPAKTSSGVPS